jgi:ABC-2 type transport system permease protein
MAEVMKKGIPQIVWTIAVKDILDAVKNKATLTFLILTVAMILMNNISFTEDAIPEVIIYSGRNSSLAQKLKESSGMEVDEVGTLQEMEERLGGENDVVLGLWIPDDVDDAREAGDGVTFEGYVVHWARDAQVMKLKSQVEGQIEELVGWDVSIHVDGNRVLPPPGLFGRAWEVSFSMVLVLTFLALFLVPNLIVVEKRTKTMDALLISPASAGQMALAKALAGMFYYLTAVVVILTFNWELVVHFGVLSLAILGGGIFSIGLGLLLGYLLDRQMILNAISYALLMGLMAPIFLTLFTSYLPDFLGDLLGLVPTVSFAKLLELAFSGGVFLEQTVFSGVVLLLSGVLVWTILVWRERRKDR